MLLQYIVVSQQQPQTHRPSILLGTQGTMEDSVAKEFTIPLGNTERSKIATATGILEVFGH